MLREINKKILFITEDFPSGLNGTSVKTRNTLNYLLDAGYKVDVCCFLFKGFNRHDFKHNNLRIFTFESKRFNKKSISFIYHAFFIVFSIAPITIKRLFNKDLEKKLIKLKNTNSYRSIFYDGYSNLQYLNKDTKNEHIYIDDEDFTDLFRQRLLLERDLFKKIFYFFEYLKSLLFEFIYMRRVDQVWAISSNTKNRLKRVTGVKTVLMPTIISLNENLFNENGYKIVFTGTLNWRENVEGLKWFISNHWNKVIANIPSAELVIIGQGASLDLISYLESHKNISYKGYVESLDEEYKQATLAIAPVRINAGIKVKILTYMSYGLPVISTKKAALGLVSTDGILVSSDKNFSRCIIKLLQSLRLRKYLSGKSHQNIKNNYSNIHLKEFLFKHFNKHE